MIRQIQVIRPRSCGYSTRHLVPSQARWRCWGSVPYPAPRLPESSFRHSRHLDSTCASHHDINDRPAFSSSTRTRPKTAITGANNPDPQRRTATAPRGTSNSSAVSRQDKATPTRQMRFFTAEQPSKPFPPPPPPTRSGTCHKRDHCAAWDYR